MSVQNIMDKLYAEIVADNGGSGLFTALGGRVYPVEGKQDSALPHMTFFIPASTPIRYMGAAVAQDVLVQFDIWANKESGSDSANDIETKLYALLESKQLTSTPTGYDRAVCTFNSRGAQTVEEDAIRLTDEVRIQATDF
jgi:hypothetical protein